MRIAFAGVVFLCLGQICLAQKSPEDTVDLGVPTGSDPYSNRTLRTELLAMAPKKPQDSVRRLHVLLLLDTDDDANRTSIREDGNTMNRLFREGFQGTTVQVDITV